MFNFKTIKTKEFLSKLYNVAKEQSLNIHNYSIDISYDKEMSAPLGTTYLTDDFEKLDVKIGTKYLTEAKIPYIRACAVAYCMFHELEHVKQYDKKFRDKDFLNMSIVKAACVRNPDYYNRTYFKDLTEIDAAYHGIKNTLIFFYTNYPNIEIENEILAIFNKQEIKKEDYFTLGDGPFTTVADLLESIKNNYLIVSKNGKYIMPYKEERISAPIRDGIFEYLDTAPKEMKNTWKTIKNNIDFDLFLAAVSFHRYELTRKCLPILQEVPCIASPDYEKLIPQIISIPPEERILISKKDSINDSLEKESEVHDH